MISIRLLYSIGGGFFGGVIFSWVVIQIKKLRERLKVKKLKKKVELIDPKEKIVIPLVKKSKKEKEKKEEKPYVFENDLRELNPKPKLTYRPKYYQGNRYVRGFK